MGDYLGGRDAAARETARLVIGSLSLRGVPLDGALRLMISFVKLLSSPLLSSPLLSS